MNLNWITEPLALYGAIASISAAALHLFLSSKAELRRQALRHDAQAGDLHKSIVRLETRLAAMALEAEQEARSRAAASAPLPTRINIQKRSEALRLFRRGVRHETVAGKIGISRAEALLLQKVSLVLAADPVPQPGGSSHDRSSSLEYSPEG